MDKVIGIIGGGVSGLFAALELSKAGYSNITLYEGSDRLGGRVNTVDYGGGVVELGAQWIHGRGQNPLWDYVQANSIQVSEETGGDGDGEYILEDGRQPPAEVLKQTIEYLDGLHDALNVLDPDELYPPSVGEYFQQRFQDFLSEESDADIAALKQSIYSWYIAWERVDTGAPDLHVQSIPSWSEYIVYDREEAEAEPILENGYHSLIIHLEKKLENKVKIELNSRVTRICWKSSPVEIYFEHADHPIQVDQLIVTVSLGVLKKEHSTMFNPNLPPQKVEAIEKMGFGTTNKIFLGFENSFWNKESGGFQILWDSSRTSNPDQLPLNWTRSITGFDRVSGQDRLLCGWICGEEGQRMEDESDQEVLDKCWRILQSRIGESVARPCYINVTRWNSDPLYRGSYSYRTPACDRVNIGPWTLAEPLMVDGRCCVQFCGEGTSISGYGTVHGAMESGLREARRLIDMNAQHVEEQGVPSVIATEI